jgi:hypothetical protein
MSSDKETQSGQRLACGWRRQPTHELKTRTTYAAVAGANLLDWPISLKELEPYYDKAESKMGVTGTNGMPSQPDTDAYLLTDMLCFLNHDEMRAFPDIYALVQKRVDEIASSMLEIGQQTPILVRADCARFVLVEGLHRLEAAKALGDHRLPRGSAQALNGRR